MTTNNFKPILFSTEMVQAILEGRKTQTRRIIKNLPNNIDKYRFDGIDAEDGECYIERIGSDGVPTERYQSIGKPKYQPGDILWVRETYFEITEHLRSFPLFQNYTADEKYLFKSDASDIGCNKWKPSIYMPKEAARIFLKVTNVRVERLQDISENDAIGEGIDRFENTLFNEMRYKDYTDGKRRDKDFNRYPEIAREIGYSHFGGNPWPDWRDPISSFQTLWQSINAKKHPWESNPWVWVYEFERIEKPENFNK